MATLSARDRRAIVVGFTVIVGALTVFRGVPIVVREVSDLHTRAVERLRELDRARDALARSAQERDSLGRVLTEIVQLAPSILEGRTAAEAAASLSSLVSLAARRHNVMVARMQAVPDSGRGRFGLVSVNVEGETDVRGLTAMLRAVETTRSLLTIRSLSVQSVDPAGRPNAPEQLRVEFTVRGVYLRSDG